MMDLNKLKSGNHPPEDINVVIEIPLGSAYIKYEMDESGVLNVDRFINTAMFYPGNYGFIPGTKAGDGCPIDVIVIMPGPLAYGCMINCRPVGALQMRDEDGKDEKIIAVPSNHITSLYQNILTVFDLDQAIRKQIQHFFKHYKDLDSNKWTEIGEFDDAEEAKHLINKYIIKV